MDEEDEFRPQPEETVDATKLYAVSAERLEEIKREIKAIEIEVLEEAMRGGKL